MPPVKTLRTLARRKRRAGRSGSFNSHRICRGRSQHRQRLLLLRRQRAVPLDLLGQSRTENSVLRRRPGETGSLDGVFDFKTSRESTSILSETMRTWMTRTKRMKLSLHGLGHKCSERPQERHTMWDGSVDHLCHTLPRARKHLLAERRCA